jgi:isopenicillin N synthase-like dioxygenase
MLDRILAEGYATARLDASDADRLAVLYQQATKFFALDAETRLRYSVPSRTTGYRPHGYAHSGYADKPDQNDSFLYWPQASKLPPNDGGITGFLAAYEDYRQVAARITAELIDALRKRYGSGGATPFQKASVAQINSYGEPSDEELLQQPHEDADFLTVIWSDAPGLEAVFGERTLPLNFRSDEVAIMPGSVMTVMTGGEIQPLFHLVRNHGITDRKSIMYFVSPDTESPIEPFVVTDYNRMTDIRQLVISNPENHFGLAPDFVSE